jgi:hypothetical protein
MWLLNGVRISKAMSRYSILISICILIIGCEGLQLNIPVQVQSVKREEAALLLLVENKSTRQIKITYPVSSGFLKQGQYTIFSFPKAGNHKVVITAYTEDRRYRDIYQPVATIDVPVFLNGYDLIKAKGNFVGYHLEVTDGMVLPNR